jgi:5-methyltetrahydrofolate--homocysteine methyltransferase
MTRKRIQEKVLDRDAEYITRQVERQVDAGATHIDVNAGHEPEREVGDMKWLTEVVSAATDLPLSFDSTSPDALRAGLDLCNRPGTIINSITGESERIEGVLPLVVEYGTGVVALTMDDGGMPEDLDGRMAMTHKLVEIVQARDIALDRVYVDHLVRPASTNPGQAPLILEAIRQTKTAYPDIHIALGLSNVSFGIPKRNNLNRVFLAMLVAAGADGAIIDPCEEGMMNTLLSSRAALGLDDFCMEYITAYRDGKLG